MSIALRRIRDRVRGHLRDFDLNAPVFDGLEIDQVLGDAYLALGAMLPPPELSTDSAFTIAAGGDTFSLPATVTQWTGNDGGAEYSGAIRIRLRSTGRFLERVTSEQLDAARSGSVSPTLSRPDRFALWEDKTQGLQGRCYPGASAAEACDLFVRLTLDDLRDFLGGGTSGMDDVKLQVSREASAALTYRAASELLAKMADEDAARLSVSKSVVPLWERRASQLAYEDARRRNDVASSGQTQRRAV